jgi:hypothetical protein
MFATAVEADGGRKVSSLPVVKDLHRVDQGPAVEGESSTDRAEFGDEDLQIEPFEIETAQVTIVEEGKQASGNLVEAWLISDVGVVDPMNGRGRGRNWYSPKGVHQLESGCWSAPLLNDRPPPHEPEEAVPVPRRP